MALLVAALADPKIPGETSKRFRLYLVDVSASVGADTTALEFINYDARHRQPDDLLAVAVFAERFAFVVDPVSAAQFPIVQRWDADVGRQATNLEGALASALVHQRQGYAGEIVLFSDGNFEHAPALDRCRTRGIRIYTVPIGAAKGFDARFAFVRRKQSALPGETVDVEVGVVGDGEGKTTVMLGEQKHELTMLPNMIRTVRFSGLGPGDYEVRLAEDLRVENNRLRFTILQGSAKPKVLVLSSFGSASPVSELLREMFDIRTDLGSLDAADAIVLENLAATQLTFEQQRVLRDAVTRGETGMVVIGGDRAYALGHYAGTPIEEILPVWAFPDERVSMVFVLDASGSMVHKLADSDQKKIEAAARAILEALQTLAEGDYAAIVQFADTGKVAHPMSDVRDRAGFERSLDRIAPVGATAVLSGVEVGMKLLRDAPTGLRRMVIITDGETKETVEEFRAAAKALADQNIKAAVVATRTEPDVDKLKALSDTVLPILDFSQLPQALRDLMSRSRDLVGEGGTARRKLEHKMAPAADLALRKHNRVSPKKGALVLYDSEQGPIAALRENVAALMFGVSEQWMGSGPVIEAAVRHVLRPPRNELRIEREGSRIRIVGIGGDAPTAEVALRDPAGRWSDANFARSSPTRFEAALDLREPGTYLFRTKAAEGILDLPCAPELERVLIDAGSLSNAGTLVTDPKRFAEQRAEAGGAEPRSVRGWLVAAAIAIFLIDLIMGAFWRG